MYYVYVLYSLRDKEFYTGYSANLKQRYTEHQNGLVDSTRHRQPLKLVYYEAYANESNARRREEFYKSGRGRETIRKILKETLEDIDSLPSDGGVG